METEVAKVAVVAIEATVAEVEVAEGPNNPEVPSIRISRQETLNGVGCIINGGKEVTFVPPLTPVLGRTSLLPALQNNEGQTSSVRLIHHH